MYIYNHKLNTTSIRTHGGRYNYIIYNEGSPRPKCVCDTPI